MKKTYIILIAVAAMAGVGFLLYWLNKRHKKSVQAVADAAAPAPVTSAPVPVPPTQAGTTPAASTPTPTAPSPKDLLAPSAGSNHVLAPQQEEILLPKPRTALNSKL